MIKSSQSANNLWTIVADDALSKFDSLLEYRELLSNLAKDADFDNFERKVMSDFHQSASHLQMKYLRLGRAKCLHFLGKLKAPDTNDHSVFDEEDLSNVEVQENIQRKKARSKLKNGRINSFRRNNNQHYRIMAKRNACRTSRKHPNNKSLSNKSEVSDKKNSKFSKETSHNDTEKVQPMKFCRKRSLKRKAEMIDKLFLESDSRSFRSGYKRPKSHMDPKKFRNTNIDLIYNSINQPIKLKEFEIKVTDFMNDTSADNDPYIARFKQANSSKVNDCGLKNNDEVLNTLGDVEVYNVLDCTVADVGFDQKAESDNDLDNNEDDENHDDDDDHSFKSPESETDDNIEEESTVTQSSPVSHEESIELRNTRSQSSCTPLSSVHVERGPRTPSPPSLPTSPRGPRSPPPSSFSSRCPRRPRTPPPPSFSPTFPRRPRTPPPPSFSPTFPRRPHTPPPPSFSPARPRGPRTPPGDAPSSDSEASDDEVRSDSSTMSTAY